VNVFVEFYLARRESKVVNSVKSGGKGFKTFMNIFTAVNIIPTNCMQIIFKGIDIFN
jgi:hypothetical protein